MSKQVQQMVIFMILAIVSYAIWNYYFNKEVVERDQPFTKGYSVQNLELKIIDETGLLTAKFTSPSLIRYTDSPVVFINTPSLVTYDQSGEHWLITSDKAEYDTSLNAVGMYDNLEAKTINEAPKIMIQADHLQLDLNTKKAHTNAGIKFQQGDDYTMTGQMAKFDLKNELLEVNNDVKAVYKAQKK